MHFMDRRIIMHSGIIIENIENHRNHFHLGLLFSCSIQHIHHYMANLCTTVHNLFLNFHLYINSSIAVNNNVGYSKCIKVISNIPYFCITTLPSFSLFSSFDVHHLFHSFLVGCLALHGLHKRLECWSVPTQVHSYSLI